MSIIQHYKVLFITQEVRSLLWFIYQLELPKVYEFLHYTTVTVIVLVKTVGYNIIIDNFRCFDSAGCGRTGTICAVDYAWDVLKCGVSLFSVICCSPLWEKDVHVFFVFL